MKILDATCGARSIWYQKKHPFVTYMDNRKVKLTSTNRLLNQRIWEVNPDVVADFRHVPFDDEHFDLVVFDPPHLIRENDSKPSSIKQKYGFLLKSEYRAVLSEGITDLFRVLKPEGVFIFKWSEVSIKVDEILKLFPYRPMFGTRTGQRNNTHWILFIKHRFEKELEEFIASEDAP